MSPDSVRIGLVGAGRMGRVHLRALERAVGVRVVAVVEPVAVARAAVAEEGYAVYERVDDVLDAGGLDAALIAAPSDRHLELVTTLAGAGVPILCEKPLGVHAGDAREAVAAAQRAGVVLQVGYWRRFVPALRRLRQRIRAGEFGELLQLACLQWDATPPTEQFRAHSGGIAVDMGVHELDQARWLTGQELGTVSAVGTARGVGGDPDAATILAQLSGGASATVSLGRWFADGDCCWIEVFGTKAHERLPFMWGAPGDQVFHAALAAQAQAFAQAVQGARLTGAGGADAIAAIDAAERAGEALSAARGVGVPGP